MSFSFLKFEKNINFTETKYCISLEIVKENFITITLRKRHRKMQLEADWCNLVKLCADWCNLVQIGETCHRLVQLGADWCNLVQFGADWWSLVQLHADHTRTLWWGTIITLTLRNNLFSKNNFWRKILRLLAINVWNKLLTTHILNWQTRLSGITQNTIPRNGKNQTTFKDN